MQHTHYNTAFKKRKFPIVLICENVSDALNIGSLFRIADAFGIEKIEFCGEHVPIGRRMTKTSRATEKAVNYEVRADASEIISDYHKKGYYIIALEISEKSRSIHAFNFPKEKPVVLIIGDENFGISDANLNQADTIIHIDMFGQNSSMNVVQATNIALYEMTKQLM